MKWVRALLVVTGLRDPGRWITKDTIGTDCSVGKDAIEVLSVDAIGHFVSASERASAVFGGTGVPFCDTGGG
jgi:hypothetical protein